MEGTTWCDDKSLVLEGKMNPKISIIIPVYNGEAFIEKCMKSILMQTMQELQIIVVDDGSTDHTYEILRKMAVDDTRIEIIHQKNCGVAKARNKGLSSARGEWIMFVDSDDTIDNDYCASMFEAANMLNVDVLISYSGLGEKKIDLLEERKKLILASLSYDEASFTFNIDAPWGKLFRNSVLQKKHIKFPEKLTRSEDALFCASVYENVDDIGTMNRSGYIHNKREGSLCRSFSPNGMKMLELILSENQKWILAHHPFERDYFRALWYRVLPGIVECETSYFLHYKNTNSCSKNAIEYQRFLRQKKVREAIRKLKISEIENRQYRIRLCFYKLSLGWLFIMIKRK